MSFLADNAGDVAAAWKKIKEDETKARGEVERQKAVENGSPSTHTGSGGLAIPVSPMNPSQIPPGYLGMFNGAGRWTTPSIYDKKPDAADCGAVHAGGIR